MEELSGCLGGGGESGKKDFFAWLAAVIPLGTTETIWEVGKCILPYLPTPFLPGQSIDLLEKAFLQLADPLRQN